MFIAGCEENQVRFHPRFDLIILLIESGGFVREEHHAELAHGRVEPPLLKGKALGVSLLPPRRWRMA